MLTKLIVDLYGWIIEIFLWFILLASGVAGFLGAVPILKDFGLIPQSEATWQIFGAVAAPIAAFLLLVVLFGPILVLVDIRKSVRALEAMNKQNNNGPLQTEYREPHL
jgi:hypothetical protein